ncbi:hypothetical protein ABZW30_46825 [Kitasatospora sp. NPDC004669]|uniref:hypothetical protein n=1 Tax=Kitasatospora sp. NPDC004669 TaxID=3154555 RepID=UPI0033A9D6DB
MVLAGAFGLPNTTRVSSTSPARCARAGEARLSGRGELGRAFPGWFRGYVLARPAADWVLPGNASAS